MRTKTRVGRWRGLACRDASILLGAALVLTLPAARAAGTAPGAQGSRGPTGVRSDRLLKPQPYSRPSQTWIVLTGQVTSVGRRGFRLDYGNGTIPVQLAQPKQIGAPGIEKGQTVVVSGIVDDHLFRSRTVDADAIYVRSLGKYVYGNALSPPGPPTYVPLGKHEHTILRGKVTAVDEGNDEFTLNTGLDAVQVDTGKLLGRPLGAKGKQSIAVGDDVAVTGKLDFHFFGHREFEADSVTLLRDANG